jgi:hypothetical protein
MLGFFLAIGKQGSGKTALITKFIIDNRTKLNDKTRIFSNYELIGIDYTPCTFNNKLERDKGKLDVLEQLQKDPKFFNNSIMAFDEIHIYFDSRDWMSENSRIVQVFFSQLRKRRILLFGTTQYIMNFDVKLRRQCMNVFSMKYLGRSDIFEGVIFNVETHDIDGVNTKFISSYKIDLEDYFQYYDTEEIIE